MLLPAWYTFDSHQIDCSKLVPYFHIHYTNDNTDPYLALLMVIKEHPKTWIAIIGGKEKKKLFSHHTRSIDPADIRNIIKAENSVNVSENLNPNRNNTMTEQQNRLDIVRIETGIGFSKIGRILQRGFIVESEGTTYERNCKHVLFYTNIRVDEDIPHGPAHKQEATKILFRVKLCI